MKAILILLFVAIIVGALINGYYHEQVHVAIYRDYNISSNVKYFDKFSMTTTADRPCPNGSCELAHEINEVIGYNLMGFYFLIGTFAFVICVQLFMIFKQKEMEMDLKYGIN